MSVFVRVCKWVLVPVYVHVQENMVALKIRATLTVRMRMILKFLSGPAFHAVLTVRLVQPHFLIGRVAAHHTHARGDHARVVRGQ